MLSRKSSLERCSQCDVWWIQWRVLCKWTIFLPVNITHVATRMTWLGSYNELLNSSSECMCLINTLCCVCIIVSLSLRSVCVYIVTDSSIRFSSCGQILTTGIQSIANFMVLMFCVVSLVCFQQPMMVDSLYSDCCWCWQIGASFSQSNISVHVVDIEVRLQLNVYNSWSMFWRWCMNIFYDSFVM